MGWLVSQVVTSMLGAVIVVKILETIFGGILGPAATAVKTGLFVGVWTTITTALGMRGFKKTVRGLRQSNKEVVQRTKLRSILLPKDKRLK